MLNAPGCRIADRGVPWIPVIPGPIDAVDRSRVAVRSRSDDGWTAGGHGGVRDRSREAEAKPLPKILPHRPGDCHEIIEPRLDLDVPVWIIPFANIPISARRAKPERSWQDGHPTEESNAGHSPCRTCQGPWKRSIGSEMQDTQKVYGRSERSPGHSRNTRKTSTADCAFVIHGRVFRTPYAPAASMACEAGAHPPKRMAPENISALPDQNQPSGLSTFTPTLRVLLVMTGWRLPWICR